MGALGGAEARGSWQKFWSETVLSLVAGALQGSAGGKHGSGVDNRTLISKQNVCRLHVQRKEEYFQSVPFKAVRK